MLCLGKIQVKFLSKSSQALGHMNADQKPLLFVAYAYLRSNILLDRFGGGQ